MLIATPRRILIAAAVAVPLVWAAQILSSTDSAAEGTRIAVAGPVTYQIPDEYRPSNVSGRSVFLQVSLPDWEPLGRDAPGWEDNVNILISPQPAPIGMIYDLHYDGSPVGAPGPSTEIVRTYRAEPDLTVEVMGSVYDTVLPDQDRATMPLGFMRCTRPDRPHLPNAACSLMFDQDGQRWKVTFGRQFMSRHTEFRERAVALMESFRMENE